MFFHKDYPWGFQKGGVAIDPTGTNFFRAPVTYLPPESKATPYNDTCHEKIDPFRVQNGVIHEIS